MTVQATAAQAKSDLALAESPDALYAAAFSALHASPAVASLLSPMTRPIFAAAYSVVSEEASGIVSDLGAAALAGTVAVFGEDAVSAVQGVAGAVASGVGDALPVINIFVSIVEILNALPHAQGSPNDDATTCTIFWNSMPGRSGPSDPTTGVTATTPSDIFASAEPALRFVAGRSLDALQAHGVPLGPLAVAPPDYFDEPMRGKALHQALSMRSPNNALGACLAAITEYDPALPDAPGDPEYGDSTADGASGPSGPNSVTQNGFHNRTIALGGAAHEYPIWHLSAWMAEGQPSVGIPSSHVPIYAALRRAIASNGPDRGVVPWALYMDLLTSDFDAGHLTQGYVAHLLAMHYFYAAHAPSDIALGGNFYGGYSACGIAPPALMAEQIVALVAAWKKTRAHIQAVQAASLAGTLTTLGRPLAGHDRAIAEVKARAAGASPLQIAAASPLGWSPSESPKLNGACQVALELGPWRQKALSMASKKVTMLSFGALKGILPNFTKLG